MTVGGPLDEVARRLGGVADEENRTVTVEVRTSLADVVRALDALDVTVEDLQLRRPTLDEVFLQLTDKEAIR